jgi:nitroreductase/NAD-dependent dihydropyrimidine dehydrogenase PreA subunit
MDFIEIKQDTCIEDGICAAVCPVGIIRFENGSYPSMVSSGEDVCIRCGHCVAVCPTGSFNHSEMKADQCPPVDKAFALTVDECEQFLRGRRSIRVYKEDPVARDNLAKLIDIARYAPTGHNSQPVEWLVLGNRKELKNLSGIVADWMRWMVDEKPEIAASINLEKTLQRWERGIDVILRDAPAVVLAHAEKNNRTAVSSCVIALTYLELAAKSMGLGCCWAGFFNTAAASFPAMKQALGLPEGHQCFGAMMVGYPRYRYHRLPLRKEPSITWRM